MTDSAAALAELGLFTGAAQHDNFCRLPDLLPTGKMTPSTRPHDWPTGDPITLPACYEFAGKSRSIEEFFVETDTAALLLLQDGVIRYERYALTGGPDVPWISWSVAKSFVSALVGIALSEGHINSIDDPISDYVPVQPGSAYDGVSIRDVLQMSSGARWNEDYSDITSDIYRLTVATVGIGTLDEFVAGVERETQPGTVCRYNSADTQVLGALLVRATNRSITDYMQEKLYEPLGMSSPGCWLLDSTGMEVAFAGLNLTARDFAKLGELYRKGGMWQGKQIVPASWVHDSLTSDAAHLQPGQPFVGGHRLGLGYGYQWWLGPGERGDFSAIGVYNQFVYVDPASDVVIVKLSANHAYGTTSDESTNRELETIEFLRSIADACSSQHA